MTDRIPTLGIDTKLRQLWRVLRSNVRLLLVDLVVVTGWVAVLSTVFRMADGPGWAFLMLLVGGIVLYTLLSKPLTIPSEND